MRFQKYKYEYKSGNLSFFPLTIKDSHLQIFVNMIHIRPPKKVEFTILQQLRIHTVMFHRESLRLPQVFTKTNEFTCFSPQNVQAHLDYVDI